jgi:TubC N-terminal docking domain
VIGAAEILRELTRRGVTVRVEGETVKLRPKAALDDDLLARLRQHKAEILALIAARPATCAASCYEIEPGRRIHHPWDGCTTRIVGTGDEVEPARWWQAGQSCWHCSGSGKCKCLVCDVEIEPAPGVCTVCRGAGRILRIQ